MDSHGLNACRFQNGQQIAAKEIRTPISKGMTGSSPRGSSPPAPGMDVETATVFRPRCLGIQEVTICLFMFLRLCASAATFPSSHVGARVIASPEIQGQTSREESLGCITNAEGLTTSSRALEAVVAGAVPGAAPLIPLPSADTTVVPLASSTDQVVPLASSTDQFVPLASSTDQVGGGDKERMEPAGGAGWEAAGSLVQAVQSRERNGMGDLTEIAEGRGSSATAGVRRSLFDSPEATVRTRPPHASTVHHACLGMRGRPSCSADVLLGVVPWGSACKGL